MYVLEKLWREGLSPNERCTHKESEYQKMLLKICDEGKLLSKELTEEGKLHFEAYEKAQLELATVGEREVFIEAFRLGARLVLDIVGEYRGCFYSPTKE